MMLLMERRQTVWTPNMWRQSLQAAVQAAHRWLQPDMAAGRPHLSHDFAQLAQARKQQQLVMGTPSTQSNAPLSQWCMTPRLPLAETGMQQAVPTWVMAVPSAVRLAGGIW